jgi:hypothetical protein
VPISAPSPASFIPPDNWSLITVLTVAKTTLIACKNRQNRLTITHF